MNILINFLSIGLTTFNLIGFNFGFPATFKDVSNKKLENSTLSVTVDRIENDNAVIEVSYNNYLNFVDIPQEKFNTIKREGEKIRPSTVVGKFEHLGEWYKGENFSEAETYYQFKSNDNNIWWALTLEDLSLTPDADAEYTLIYYDNDTPGVCECEVYDDIFLAIYK